MTGQKINPKYLDELKGFFEHNSLEDFGVIYDNEKYFKDYLEAQTFKFTNSGTSALYLILKQLRRDGCMNVWGPAFTHISWINCANWEKMPYDFVDVNPHTLSMCPIALQEKIDKEGAPDILIMVDMAGYVGSDTVEIQRICKENLIEFIEDAAHAFGQSYGGTPAGMFGDYSFYSFSNPKLLTCGEGGAVLSRKYDLDKIMEEQIYQGGWYRDNKTEFSRGLNFIMSNMNTELLKYQLRDLSEIMEARQKLFREIQEKTPKVQYITHASDNSDYAPSIFCYKVPTINKRILEKVPHLICERYKNMGHPEYYPVSQKLQESLIYWRA